MILKRTLVLFVCLAMAAVSLADDLDTYVRDYMRERHVPAVVWGVFKDGKVAKPDGPHNKVSSC